MPRTRAPDWLKGDDTPAAPSIIGITSLTPGTLATRASTASKSVSGVSTPCRKMCPLMPTILLSSSARNPFITDITTISVATPSMMPRNEKAAMTEMKLRSRRARR